jgi:hypothetical protein
MINVAMIRVAEDEIDRCLPKGVVRVRGGIVLDVRFDSGDESWGAKLTYSRHGRVRDHSTSDVYADPETAVQALLRSVRETPRDLW